MKFRFKIGFALLGVIFLLSLAIEFSVLKASGVELDGKNLSLLLIIALGAGLVAFALCWLVLSWMGDFYFLKRTSAEQFWDYISSAKQGRFREKIENLLLSGIRDNLEIPLKDFNQSTASVLSEARQLTEDLSELSSQIMLRSRELAKASGTQIKSVDETGQSIGRIDSGIREILGQVDELKNLSQETNSASLVMMNNIHKVSGLAEDLAGFVRDLVSAISQMVSNIHSVAQVTESLFNSSNQSSLSMREIDQATQEIRKHAEQSAKISLQTRERAVKASELIQNWAEGMGTIESAVKQATQVMEELTQQAEAIGEIVTVIDGIASETHLLSLNASIMAAKAGEHGRGFMVVAIEIKELARRTSESTKEIEALINRTRKAVQNSGDSIIRAYQRTQQGILWSKEARSAISEVLAQVETSSQYAQEIAHATEAQVELARQVYQSASEVDERTQLIKTAMREQEDSSSYLKERAGKMRELTERVKNATKEQAESSQQVSKAVEEVNATVEVIRSATLSQSYATGEIIKAMAQVKKASDLIAISVENVENTAVSVLNQSLILAGGIKGFELPALPPKFKIGLFLDNLREERWRREREIFRRRCERLGAEVLEAVAEGNPELQVKQAEQLINQGAQILVIIASDANQAGEVVETAHKSGVKVIAYDRLIKNCELDLFITYAYDQTGRRMVEYMLRRKPEGNYFLLLGSERDLNAIQLRAGQRSALEPAIRSGKVKLIGESWTRDWSPEEAYRTIRNFLTRSQVPDVIIASNDGTAGGVIKALKESGLAGKVLVSGMDADLEACRRIIKGEQLFTIYMPVRLQAVRAAESALLLIQGQEIIGADQLIDNGKAKVRSILLHPVLVDAENIKEVIVADGFHSEKELYAQ